MNLEMRRDQIYHAVHTRGATHSMWGGIVVFSLLNPLILCRQRQWMDAERSFHINAMVKSISVASAAHATLLCHAMGFIHVRNVLALAAGYYFTSFELFDACQLIARRRFRVDLLVHHAIHASLGLYAIHRFETANAVGDQGAATSCCISASVLMTLEVSSIWLNLHLADKHDVNSLFLFARIFFAWRVVGLGVYIFVFLTPSEDLPMAYGVITSWCMQLMWASHPKMRALRNGEPVKIN